MPVVEAMMEFTSCIDVASVLRDQFMTFEALGRAVRLNPDHQQCVVLPAPDDWLDWFRFQDGGPLPAQRMPPIMLQRLACRLERRHPTGT